MSVSFRKVSRETDFIQIEHVLTRAGFFAEEGITETAADIAHVHSAKIDGIFCPFGSQRDVAEALLFCAVVKGYGRRTPLPVVSETAGKEFNRFPAVCPAGKESQRFCPGKVHSLTVRAAVIQARNRFPFRKPAVQKQPAAPVRRHGDLRAADTAFTNSRVFLPVFIHIHDQGSIPPGHLCFLSKMVFGIPEVPVDINTAVLLLQQGFKRRKRMVSRGPEGIVARSLRCSGYENHRHEQGQQHDQNLLHKRLSLHCISFRLVRFV